MNYKKKLFRSSAIVFIFLCLGALFGYMQKFFLSRLIDVDQIGLFYSVLSFISFFIFLRDLGLSDSLIYFIPKLRLNGKKVEIKSILFFSFIVQLIIGMFFFIFIQFLTPYLTKYYFKDNQAIIILFWLSIYYITHSVYEILYTSFQGYQNMFLNQLMEFLFQVLNFIGFFYVLSKGLPIYWLAIIYFISSSVISTIFFFIFVLFVFKDFLTTKVILTKKFINRLFNFSIPVMTEHVAIQIFGNQSIFFLTFFSNYQSVGYYVMCRALAKTTIFITRSVMLTAYPILSELWEKKNFFLLQKIYDNILVVSFYAVFPFCATLFIHSSAILKLLYGVNYIAAGNVLKIFGFYFLFTGINGLTKRIFMSKGNPRLARRITLMTLVINIIFNLFLIPFYDATGAVLSDFISVIIPFFYGIFLLNQINLKFPLFKIIKILFAGALYMSFLNYFFNLFNTVILVRLIISCFFSGMIYVTVLVLFNVININKIIVKRELF